ncbi:MAG: hypothetical protein GFH27_549325n19 [Chloroflexi bacterium AL-W]|nr:hypothetical protein [Chloroflexi bacterium AL-N1]NOK70131.1 hypothetical protein [Chloroflexi bacterium AL-N10]NOK77857.1 hypothetical protein [Chloroflexi bacterium AL-N5]NOK84866.1 hypothetical protein [Chloroflexi bacterium AL-W]NOK91845.1 hypothetical protein [Chloroflexi bacterium AL-N15]
MGFRKRNEDTTDQNVLDRTTKAVAVATSRRGFLRKLPLLGFGMGIGASLGLATSSSKALAGTCCGVTVNCPSRPIYDCVPCGSGHKTRKRTYTFVCQSNCNYSCEVKTEYPSTGCVCIV